MSNDRTVEIDTTMSIERRLCAEMTTSPELSEKRLLFVEIILLCRMYKDKLDSKRTDESYDRDF